MILAIVAVTIVLFLLGYRLYGRFLGVCGSILLVLNLLLVVEALRVLAIPQRHGLSPGEALPAQG